MPRIAKPQSPDVAKAVDRIRTFCVLHKLSTNQMATCCGVGQPALHLFLKGKRKTVTETALKTLAFIDSWNYSKNVTDKSFTESKAKAGESIDVVVASALQLWDGDPATLGVLSEFLAALKPAFTVLVKQRRDHDI